MNGPCEHCPFRTDIPPFIRRGRGEEIARDVLFGDGLFPCHKTVDYDDAHEGRVTGASRWCIGAVLLMEKSVEQGAARNQMVRIHARLGALDLDRLDRSAPVAESVEDWLRFLDGAQ